MAVSRAMRRLLRVLDIEEEQSRLALESAAGELKNLERALLGAAGRGRRGRSLVAASARSGELEDRLAGIEETLAAARCSAALRPRIANTEVEVTGLRQAFLAKRVERRQAETLIREAEAKDAIEAGRRVQRSLDDWYLNRLQGQEAAGESGSGGAR